MDILKHKDEIILKLWTVNAVVIWDFSPFKLFSPLLRDISIDCCEIWAFFTEKGSDLRVTRRLLSNLRFGK